MKPLFHGKHYYIEIKGSGASLIKDKIFEFLHEQKELNDEEFFLYWSFPTKSWVIWSRAKCGDFRGNKHSAWERVKRYAYKVKKEV